MPAIPGSVRVTGLIAPSDTADTYPTHAEEYGRGGFRTVADIAARNALPTDRRALGMLVRVLDAGGGQEKFYTLRAGLANGDWVEDTTGGAGVSGNDTYVTATTVAHGVFTPLSDASVTSTSNTTATLAEWTQQIEQQSAQISEAIAGARTYLLTSASSDVVGLGLLTTAGAYADVAQTLQVSVREETEWLEIGRWVTPPGQPGVTSFPAGSYVVEPRLHVSANAVATNVRARVVHRSGETETQIGIGQVEVRALASTKYRIEAPVAAAVTVLPSDRLEVILEAETRSLVDFVTVTMTYDGPAVTSFSTPIVGEPLSKRAYPLAFYFAGTPEQGAKIRTLFVSDVQLPGGLTGLQINCDVNPTALTYLLVKLFRAGVEQQGAAITIDTDGSWAFTVPWNLPSNAAAGDVLEVSFPDQPDATLSGVAITILGILP